jgi:hypothetical protein
MYTKDEGVSIPQNEEKTTEVVDSAVIAEQNRRVVFLPTGKKIKEADLEKDFDDYLKNNKNSYIKQQRVGHEWDKKDNLKKVWDVLMRFANFAELIRCGVKLRRGELLATYKLLAKHTGLSEEQVRYAVGKLETKYGELHHVDYRGVQIYTMLKYEEHQGPKTKMKEKSYVEYPAKQQPIYNLTFVVDNNNCKEIIELIKKGLCGELGSSNFIGEVAAVEKETGEVHPIYESSLSIKMRYENKVDVSPQSLKDSGWKRFKNVTEEPLEEIWNNIDCKTLISAISDSDETDKKTA